MSYDRTRSGVSLPWRGQPAAGWVLVQRRGGTHPVSMPLGKVLSQTACMASSGSTVQPLSGASGIGQYFMFLIRPVLPIAPEPAPDTPYGHAVIL